MAKANDIGFTIQKTVDSLPPPQEIWELYKKENSVHRVGKIFGVSGERIRQHLKVAGYRLNHSKWEKEELEALESYYKNTPDELFWTGEIAGILNRTQESISIKAGRLGFGRMDRACSDRTRMVNSIAQKEKFNKPSGALQRQRISERMREWHKTYEHPRGATGMKLTEENKVKMKEGTMAARADPNHAFNSDEYRQALSDRASQRAGNALACRCHSNGKSGFRDDIGVFVRSCWEANYARHLNFLIKAGEVKSWEYEPQTFWFLEIKRGTRSYKPDFKVTLKDGSIEYHEVKGWMTQRARTALKRMGIYYPEIKMILIDSKRYKEISKSMSAMLPNWE